MDGKREVCAFAFCSVPNVLTSIVTLCCNLQNIHQLGHADTIKLGTNKWVFQLVDFSLMHSIPISNSAYSKEDHYPISLLLLLDNWWLEVMIPEIICILNLYAICDRNYNNLIINLYKHSFNVSLF